MNPTLIPDLMAGTYEDKARIRDKELVQKAENVKKEIDWSNWRNHPVTIEFIQILQKETDLRLRCAMEESLNGDSKSERVSAALISAAQLEKIIQLIEKGKSNGSGN